MSKRKDKLKKRYLQTTGGIIYKSAFAKLDQQFQEASNDITKSEFYPIINEFPSIQAYDDYIEKLIEQTKFLLSDSKDKLGKMIINFKFNSTDQLIGMNYIRFLYNIIMWRVYIVPGIEVTEKALFRAESFHNKKYAEYFDKFGDMYRDRFTMAEYSEILCDIQTHFNKIAVELGPLFGASISVYDMVKMAKKNSEIEALFNTQIDLDNFNVKDVEEFITHQTERMFKIMSEMPDDNNPLKPMIRAGFVGLNKRQAAETFIHRGFKPDLQGNTLPITSNTSFMNKGLDSPQAFFVDGQGARKAAIMQLNVASAG